ncbi:MAG: hypothetical protein ACOYUB_04630 [Patescibacteria group bacterium]
MANIKDKQVVGIPSETSENLKKRLTNVENTVYVAIIVLLVSFLTLLFTIFGMTINSFIDYKNVVNQFNSEKYLRLEEKINKIETSLTPTPTLIK